MSIYPIIIVFLAILIYKIFQHLKTTKKAIPDNVHEDEILKPPKLLAGVRRETAANWESSFIAAGLGEHWEKFKPLLRSEITFTAAQVEEDKLMLGQSKVGGRPDLPKHIKWFREENGRVLSFLAQINFSEVNALDKANILPTSGIVYFFYSAEQEAWGFDPKDKDKFKVYYIEGGEQDLQRVDFPSDLDTYSRYKSCALNFKQSYSLPGWESNEVEQLLTQKEMDLYIDLAPDGEINKLLGYSDNIQGSMEEECQLVTHGIYCGDPSGYEDPKAILLTKYAHQWRLLLQIDSIEEAGMMWGDAGRVYFWITEEDLKNKRFEKCWFTLQCY